MDLNEATRPLAVAGSFVALFLVYQLARAVYSVYFHPLRKIPGPWYAAASRLAYSRHLMNGTTVPYLRSLHDIYGDVVRYSPNEVSVISGEEAWQDIYGFRIGKSKGAGQYTKDTAWYAPPMDGVPSMLIAPEGVHGKQRKILSHAFSDKALRDQEGLLQSYADLLVNRLKQTSAKSSDPVDLCVWYNWTTFDVIADLIFGEPFGCLANTSTHEYVELILNTIYVFPIFYIVKYFPFMKSFMPFFITKGAMQKRVAFHQFVRESTKKRIERKTDRPDFTTAIMGHYQPDIAGVASDGVSLQEITSNNGLFLIAGTETTATTLSSVTFHILKYPKVMQKLKDEIRNTFKSDQDITVEACNGLEYMLAVLNESLRIMPPVPAGFLRKVPPGGGTVSGHYLPGGCNASVSVTQFVSYHSERNFKDPEDFVPERWLGDERYKDDNRATFNPFSFGPRNCIGKNLAYAEMRLFLAKMIYHFDMELDPRAAKWSTDIKVLGLYVKPELLVKLTPVVA